MVLKPKKLEKGETVGVVGPASPMIKGRLAKGIRYLEKCGYRVKLGKHVYDEYGYLAGVDSARAHDLNQMFGDPEVAAIFCVRGGYGTPRLLNLINYEAIQNNPKIFVGYSDVTALQLAIFKKTSVVTFSGPMVAVEMGKGIHPFTERHFWPIITQSEPVTTFKGFHSPLKGFKGGTAEGRLLGGCLSLICTLLGTPFLPDFHNAILFLEDVGEEPYKIDRCLTQLKLAGLLNQISGLVFGKFEDCEPKTKAPTLTIDQIMQDVALDLDIPIVADLPYGHVDEKYTLPIGVNARLDGENGYLEILEKSVA